MRASDSFCAAVVRYLRRSEAGATAIEYGLVAGILAIGVIGALTLTRQSLRTQYDCVALRLDSAGATVCVSAQPRSSGLTGEASRAQGLLPPGLQIVAGGLFYDAAGGTAYAATLRPSSAVADGIALTLSATDTGQTTSLDVTPVAPGVVEVPSGILGALGVQPAGIPVPSGYRLVLLVVPDSAGVPRLYYGSRPE